MALSSTGFPWPSHSSYLVGSRAATLMNAMSWLLVQEVPSMQHDVAWQAPSCFPSAWLEWSCTSAASDPPSPFRHDVKRPDAERSSDIMRTGCTEDLQHHVLAAHVVCPLNLHMLLRLEQATSVNTPGHTYDLKKRTVRKERERERENEKKRKGDGEEEKREEREEREHGKSRKRENETKTLKKKQTNENNSEKNTGWMRNEERRKYEKQRT